MKQIYLLFFVLLVAVSGCKKGESPIKEETGDYYIRFKVDGAQKSYTAQIPNNMVGFFLLPEYNFYTAAITGLNNLQDAQVVPVKNSISISVRSKEAIKTNVDYQLQNPVPYSGINFSGIELVYTDEQGESFAAVLLRSNYPSIFVGDEAMVRFTEITSSHAKGIFSATAYSTRNKAEISITDGEFYLKSHHQ